MYMYYTYICTHVTAGLVKLHIHNFITFWYQWYHPKNLTLQSTKETSELIRKEAQDKLLIYRKGHRLVVVLPIMIFIHHMHTHVCTVEPLYNGQLGATIFVHYSGVSALEGLHVCTCILQSGPRDLSVMSRCPL